MHFIIRYLWRIMQIMWIDTTILSLIFKSKVVNKKTIKFMFVFLIIIMKEFFFTNAFLNYTYIFVKEFNINTKFIKRKQNVKNVCPYIWIPTFNYPHNTTGYIRINQYLFVNHWFLSSIFVIQSKFFFHQVTVNKTMLYCLGSVLTTYSNSFIQSQNPFTMV